MVERNLYISESSLSALSDDVFINETPSANVTIEIVSAAASCKRDKCIVGVEVRTIICICP